MITVCPKCSSRIQPNGKGASVTCCPKCNYELPLPTRNPASEKSALAVGNSPSTEGRRHERSSPAPLFELETDKLTPNDGGDKLLQMLASILIQKDAKGPLGESLERPSWNRRKVLVCTTEEYRSKLAGLLAQEGYQVFVASDTKQAVERMRENQLDVVLLEPQFDAPDQGAAFVVREVNVLRPAQRRRLFFVLLSPTLRTMDAHAAFLNNVNAVINVKDISELKSVLDEGLREYNELYRDFNTALNLTAI
jgi:CheY-like chemotaxis protein